MPRKKLRCKKIGFVVQKKPLLKNQQGFFICGELPT
jgi:hypothetical protein